MADFPAIVPDRRSYELPQFLVAAAEWPDGSITRHAWSENPSGLPLTLRWDAMTPSERQAIEEHWAEQQGNQLPFSLPAEVWCGNSLAGSIDTPTTTWRWAGEPSIADGPAGTAQVEATLVGTETATTATSPVVAAAAGLTLESSVAAGYTIATRSPDPTSIVSERIASIPGIEWDEIMLLEPLTYATNVTDPDQFILKWDDFFGSGRHGLKGITLRNSSLNAANYAEGDGQEGSGRWEVVESAGSPEVGFSGRLGTAIVRFRPTAIWASSSTDPTNAEWLMYAGNGGVSLQYCIDGNIYASMLEAYDDQYDDNQYGGGYVYNDEVYAVAGRPYSLNQWTTCVMRWKEFDMATGTAGEIYLSVNGNAASVAMPYRSNFPGTSDFGTGRNAGTYADAVGFYWSDAWVPDWRVGQIVQQMEAIA